MQLQLPFLQAALADPRIDFVRVRRARRYILRVRPDGSLRVTVPRSGSRAEAMKFLEQHLQWILEERLRITKQHPPIEWVDGDEVLLHGVPARIAVSPVAPAAVSVGYGGRRFEAPAGIRNLRPLIQEDLRRLAREALPPRLHALAAGHGLCVAKVSIRNQKSRWGSCSRAGHISLNFRLVQMPPEVCDYVLIHELMHLKQQNHGPRFWRLVAEACPGYRTAEDWLKTHGRALF